MAQAWARARQEAELLRELASISPRELDTTPAPVKLCGVVSDDYPELVCEYPEGHGLISEADEDIFEMEHGAPSKGGWFTNPGPVIPPLTFEEQIHAAKREALQSVLELLSSEGWTTTPAGHEHRAKIAIWLEYRIELFDRGIWSALPGGEEADVARSEEKLN